MSKNNDDVDLGKGKVLGTGAKPPVDGDLAKAALPPKGETLAGDATVPGVQAADTLGANAPGDDSKKGDDK